MVKRSGFDEKHVLLGNTSQVKRMQHSHVTCAVIATLMYSWRKKSVEQDAHNIEGKQCF